MLITWLIDAAKGKGTEDEHFHLETSASAIMNVIDVVTGGVKHIWSSGRWRRWSNIHLSSFRPRRLGSLGIFVA